MTTQTPGTGRALLSSARVSLPRPRPHHVPTPGPFTTISLPQPLPYPTMPLPPAPSLAYLHCGRSLWRPAPLAVEGHAWPSGL